MRLSSGLLGLVSGALLTLAAAGCGSNANKKVTCQVDADCKDSLNTPFTQDLDVAVPPQCCSDGSGSFCVVQAQGCDTGFRYVFSAPQVGDCVPTTTCTLPPPPDMAMQPEDLSRPEHD